MIPTLASGKVCFPDRTSSKYGPTKYQPRQSPPSKIHWGILIPESQTPFFTLKNKFEFFSSKDYIPIQNSKDL